MKKLIMITKEAFNQKIPIEIWKIMQEYHDYIAREEYWMINHLVDKLESNTNFKFPELKII
jgi:hypothetical protein